MLRLKSNYFKVFMKLNGVKYGNKLNLYGIPVVFKFKDASITIGNSCTIRSSFLSNLIGLYQRTIIVARDSGKIMIGNNVGLSGVTIYARKLIEIGDNATIGANTKIMDNDFHPIDTDARLNNDNTKIKSREVIIGDNVFIGCNSLILKGTSLGNNCVVGAGSVVSGQFPGDVVIAGNPAKIIRSLV